MIKLTDEQVVRVLATYEGWTEVRPLPDGPLFSGVSPEDDSTIGFGRRPREVCPDYLGSLDVMRRVEEKMRYTDRKLWWQYVNRLFNRTVKIYSTDPLVPFGKALETSAAIQARCAAQALYELKIVKLNNE